MAQILDNCPVCSGQMIVKELECMSCKTRVISEFDNAANPLNIDPDLVDFIKVFIYAEGSIKQSEKLLNCSYPKIKNLLKKAKIALGVKDEYSDNHTSIIERLDKGELSVDDALSAIKNSQT
jgi:hypothetical protein